MSIMLGNRSKAAIKSSVYKATDHKANPSKEKHVRAIILRTFSKEKDNSVEQIIRYLSIRLEKTNWAVVLKCLMIFHRCFRDGDASFMDSMKTRSNHIFSLQKFSATAPATHLYTVFVKKYAKYLEEKVSVLRLLGFQFEKNKDAIKALKPPKCFKIVPKLQSQLNALLNCKMRTQHVGTNQLIHRTYILIMKDSLALYTMLNDAILQLLDLFWKMKKKDAAKVVSIYKLFVKETDALIGLYEIGKRFVRQLPEIKKVETSIIESMEKHLDDLPDDESSDEASGSGEKSAGKKVKSKKSKTTKKKHSDDSSNGAQLKEGEDEEYDDYEDKDRKYDDDSDEQHDDSSSGGDEPAEEDLLPDFFSAPVFAPTFPQGAMPNMMGQPQSINPTFGFAMQPPEPSYQDKANFVKQIAIASDNNNSYVNNNPFGPTGQVSNPFGAITVSNPFQGAQTPNPFGVNNTHVSSNPMQIGPNPFANPSPSSGTPFGSTPTSSHMFGGQNFNNNLLNPTNPAYGNSGFTGSGIPNNNLYGSNSGFKQNNPPSGNLFGAGTGVGVGTGSNTLFTPNSGFNVNVGVGVGGGFVGNVNVGGGGNPFGNPTQVSNPFL